MAEMARKKQIHSHFSLKSCVYVWESQPASQPIVVQNVSEVSGAVEWHTIGHKLEEVHYCRWCN